MKKSELETKFFQDKTQKIFFLKKTKKIFCSKLYKKERKKVQTLSIYQTIRYFGNRQTISNRYPSRHNMSLGDLSQISIVRDISETSQRHLKRDDFFVTYFRRPKKTCLFCDIFKTSQIHLKKDAFFVTSLRRLRYISKNMSCVTSLRRLGHISKKMSFP